MNKARISGDLEKRDLTCRFVATEKSFKRSKALKSMITRSAQKKSRRYSPYPSPGSFFFLWFLSSIPVSSLFVQCFTSLFFVIHFVCRFLPSFLLLCLLSCSCLALTPTPTRSKLRITKETKEPDFPAPSPSSSSACESSVSSLAASSSVASSASALSTPPHTPFRPPTPGSVRRNEKMKLAQLAAEVTSSLPPQRLEDYQASFTFLDSDRDGFLSQAEFRQILTKLGIHHSEQDFKVCWLFTSALFSSKWLFHVETIWFVWIVSD